MTLAKEALVAVLAAAWIAGLIQQFGSLKMTICYIAISLAMAALMLGDRRVFKLVPWRNRRR